MTDSSTYQNLISPRSRAPIVLTDEDDIESGSVNEYNNNASREQLTGSVQDFMRIQQSAVIHSSTLARNIVTATAASSSNNVSSSYSSRIRRRTSSGGSGSASRTKDRSQLTTRSKSSEEANNDNNGGRSKTPTDVRKLIKQVKLPFP
jgi:hypothetical protein